jgi:4-amino-4-deoxy-L-arabinose transferase-like glycosyltransferase
MNARKTLPRNRPAPPCSPAKAGENRNSDVAHTPTETTAPVTRVEWAVLAVILAAGILIRLAKLELAAVEHFDEGVYASNLWFGEESSYQYPMRHLYAPPLLPALIEWSMILSGRTNGSIAVWPSLIAGCATIVVVWICARCWFGPTAAIAAACLTASSDVHAMFTRAALTDCLLLLFFIAALLWFERAGRSRKMVDFAVAGTISGLAWWTKYNGWLPLAVAVPGLLGLLFANSNRRSTAMSILRGWTIALAVAVVVWSPVLYSLQQHGGYSAVAANHRRYIVGFQGWTASLMRQIANLRAVDGSVGSAGWSAAVIAAWLVSRARRATSGSNPDPGTVAATFESAPQTAQTGAQRIQVTDRPFTTHLPAPSWRECCAILALSALVAALALWLGGSTLSVLLSAAGLLGCFLVRGPAGNGGRRRSANWQLVAWFLVLMVLTPLYTPYLRLVLPLLGASWLASGMAISSLIHLAWYVTESDTMTESGRPTQTHSPAVGRQLLVVLSAFAVASAMLWVVQFPLLPAWQDDRRGLERVAASIRQTLHSSSRSESADAGTGQVVYVYGEPALLFHLRAQGHPLVQPIGSLSVEPARVGQLMVPTYLAAGLHALHDPAYLSSFEQSADRFQLVASYPYQPSMLVRLDQADPRTQEWKKSIAEVRLYRMR